MYRTFALGAFLLICANSLTLSAQLHEKTEAAVAQSSAVRSVRGGTTIQIAAAYDKAFDGLVNYLKREGYNLDSASRDAGQIATALEVSGGWRQTGRRIILSVITDSASSTSIRVAVTLQKRFNAIQADPWSDPKVDEKASSDIAQKIKADLPARLAQN